MLRTRNQPAPKPSISLTIAVMVHKGHVYKSAFDFVHGENAFKVMAGEIDDDKRLRFLV